MTGLLDPPEGFGLSASLADDADGQEAGSIRGIGRPLVEEAVEEDGAGLGDSEVDD
jgi:hypothetical protein